jgi:predicted TIM-barrel fold metal-dependent hydrolase
VRYEGPVIDCDVHNAWNNAAEVIAYLPRRWKTYISDGHLSLSPPTLHYPDRVGIMRLDTYGPNQESPGSDLGLLRRQHLDPNRVERAILTFGVGQQAALANPHLANALVRAANEWMRDQWLDGQDERLYGSILINGQLPDEAAKEVERHAAHPRHVQVLFADNGLGQPLGHPVYHRIYASAAEADLTVAIHLGAPFFGGLAQFTAAARPLNRIEFFTLCNQSGMHHLTSFLVHGVFDKFPTLRVVMLEDGFNWIPWLFWQLDARYRDLKREAVSLKRLPTEYLKDHVRLSTQPIEIGERSGDAMRLWGSFEGMGDLLVYSSDYPHFDGDDRDYLARELPNEWVVQVMHDNAMRWFRWPLPQSRRAHEASAIIQ